MPRYELYYSKDYKKSVKKLDKQSLQMLTVVIDRLANDEILEPKFKDHQLKGKLEGFRECHIKPNLLLVYKKVKQELRISVLKVGSHSELFKK